MALKCWTFGRQPTPVIYFAARNANCPNVVIVTASHNPGADNGVKFAVNGRPAVPALMRELEAALETPAREGGNRVVRPCDPLPVYEKWVMKEAEAIVVRAATAGRETARQLKVAVDTMGGAFSEIAPRVLRAAGLDVVSLGTAIDPDFAARAPNPAVDENLSGLVARVVAVKADFGIGLDGDGDRVIFVDHRGRIVRPEQLGALMVKMLFTRPVVVYDLKCASVLANAVRGAGGTAIMQPSGHGFIKTTMIERQADLGVEVSGHHFYKALGGGDDGLFTALVVAGLLRRPGASLADLIDPIGWPAITPDLRIKFDGDAAETVASIARQCGGEVSRLDGVRAQYEDGWALARASITEPAITLRFEGRDAQSARSIAARFLGAEPQLRDKVMEILKSV